MSRIENYLDHALGIVEEVQEHVDAIGEEKLSFSLGEAAHMIYAVKKFEARSCCRICGCDLIEEHLHDRSYVMGVVVCENCVEMVSIPQWIEWGIERFKDLQKRGVIVD